MFRIAFAVASLALFLVPATAQVKKKDPTSFGGSVADLKLRKHGPTDYLVMSEKAWNELVKAWGIKNAPKVDFAQEFVVIASWEGSEFSITPTVKDYDLNVAMQGVKNQKSGFRWQAVVMKREGIKTAHGKELPKE